VLRLWPDSAQLGLFPDHCWLRHRGTIYEHSLPQVTGPLDEALLQAAAELLVAHADKLGKRSRIDVLVSDEIAAVMPLPWQDQLGGDQEREAYALACFEARQIAVNSEWAVRADFRQHGANGLAYALSRRWLTRLLELTTAAGYTLREVLPVSAAAYYRHRPIRGSSHSLLLLKEARRTTAFRFHGSKLLDLDVEPVTLSTSESGKRLLRRVLPDEVATSHVFEWTSQSAESAKLSPVVSQVLPQAAYIAVDRHAWS